MSFYAGFPPPAEKWPVTENGFIVRRRRSRIENLYCAVRVPRIYGGASEIQLLVIGREFMKLQGSGHDRCL
jgi:alkylation response protein AidB-like acyl-CoA dehydrogenase